MATIRPKPDSGKRGIQPATALPPMPPRQTPPIGGDRFLIRRPFPTDPLVSEPPLPLSRVDRMTRGPVIPPWWVLAAIALGGTTIGALATEVLRWAF